VVLEKWPLGSLPTLAASAGPGGTHRMGGEPRRASTWVNSPEAHTICPLCSDKLHTSRPIPIVDTTHAADN
jgi:hypothetical protein